MLLLAAYAAVSWFAIYRLRRRWAGVGMLGLSLAGVALISYLDIMIHRLIVGGDPGLIFQFILASEAAIILLVGAMLLLVPRGRAVLPCRGCGYELQGLDDANPRCPECGIEHAARRPRAGRCVQCNATLRAEVANLLHPSSLDTRCGVAPRAQMRSTGTTCEGCAIGQATRGGRAELAPIAERDASGSQSRSSGVAAMAT
jgi:predicted Zn-ribbon and HTH transcriptional regulator